MHEVYARIRYRARGLFLLVLLAPILGMITADTPAVLGVNTDNFINPQGTDYGLVTFVSNRVVNQSYRVFTRVPKTKNTSLNDEINKFVAERVQRFTGAVHTSAPNGFESQLSIVPHVDYASDNTYSIGLQVDEYQTNKNVMTDSINWLAYNNTIINTAEDIALKTDIQNLNLPPSSGALSYGLLPDYKARIYVNGDATRQYFYDVSLTKLPHLDAKFRSFYFSSYPNKISDKQQKQLSRRVALRRLATTKEPHCTVEKCVALTFDDGPRPDTTPKVLDILKEHSVHATFFTIGNQVEQNIPLVQRTLHEGHQVENHTYAHQDLMRTRGMMGVRMQIDKAQAALQAAGAQPTMLRPPYGSYNAAIEKQAGMPLVLWNIDPQEWRGTPDGAGVDAAITSRARDGGIVLLHDSKQITVEALDNLITSLENRGFRCVSIGELLDGRPMPTPHMYDMH